MSKNKSKKGIKQSANLMMDDSRRSNLSKQNPFVIWLKALRPQTLFASICPVLVGLMIARHNIAFVGVQGNAIAVLTLVCAIALQTLSNLVNDYYDFKRGTDKQGRVGFERVMTSGLITEEEMRNACLITLGVAVITGAILCFIGGLPILIIGITAIIFAWLYTATNYSLSYLGIADIFVLIYYGFIATMGTTYLQYKAVNLDISIFPLADVLRTSFFAGCVSGLISMCVLAVNNIRDMDDDCEAGKRTLPVRFGKKTALVTLSIIVLLMPIAAYFAFSFNWSSAQWVFSLSAIGSSHFNFSLLIILPAGYLLYRIFRAQGSEYNHCLMLAGIVNLIYVILTWLTLC